jgi:chromosome segregation ATPase
MNTLLVYGFLASMLVLMTLVPVQAAAPRDQGGGDALRKAQQMLQSLATEKSRLEAENLRLAEELKKSQSELESTRGSLGKVEQAHGSATQRNAALVERVRVDSDRIADLQNRYRSELGDAQADIRLLHAAVEERDRWIGECQAKNDGLYEANVELLDAYRNKGPLAALGQREPVTGLASVKVENVVQEFQFRLEDLRTVKYEPAER